MGGASEQRTSLDSRRAVEYGQDQQEKATDTSRGDEEVR